MAFNLQLEVGYWVILLSLLGCFVILIIAKRYENKNSQSDNHLITATEAVEDEGVEGKKPAASLATESVISNT